MEQKTIMWLNTILILVLVAAGLPLMVLTFVNSTSDTYQTFSIQGSTTVQPIVLLAEDYIENNPEFQPVDIQVAGGGSGAGVSGAGTGAVDLGMASRELDSDDLTDYPNLQAHPIAKDGIAVVVNVALTEVKNISMDELKAIYNGTFTTWDQVTGGTYAGTISVHNRNTGSGTRSTFKDLVLGDDDFRTDTTNHPGNSEMVAGVAGDVDGIGFCGLGYVDDYAANKPAAIGYNLSMGYYNASETTVANGNYPIARNLNLISNGDPTGMALWFINFILSDVGQEFVEQAGFIKLP
ncbi:MAG: hypothetical protein GF329_21475 [Candidatus Lokiarchaeota archaeon]|nr:hypothetical protein [Candidatus Lokiarchaeota archaeon]